MGDYLVGYLLNFADNGSWYTLTVLATFAVLLVYGLFLAIAKSFSLKKLEATSKSEMLQAAANVLMLLVLVGSLQMAEKFAINYFLGSNSYVHCGSQDIKTTDISSTFQIVQCNFDESAEQIASIQYYIDSYADVPVANSFYEKSIMIYMMGINVFRGSWVPSIYKKTEQYRIMNNFSTSILIKINTLLVVIKYISENMLTIFLPLGLLLRAFPYTRGLGALFISIAIGFYFIFPVLFVFMSPNFVHIPNMPDVSQPNSDVQESCYPSFSGVSSAASSSSSSSFSQIATIGDAARSIANFNLYISTYPFVVFAITIILVRYLIYIFGGESYAIMRYLAKVV